MGFRAYWRRKSKPKGRPSTNSEIRSLIRRMAKENPGWGAPKIHSELLKLGFDVSERTVSRYMPRRPAPPGSTQRWMTFLRNHRDAIAAMDFFTVPTIRFQILYVLFVIHHERRIILHHAVTAAPTSAWVVQQLREAFPFDQAPRFLIFDRDAKFDTVVTGFLAAIGTTAVQTAYRSPWQNGTAERWVGSVRRNMLDHVVVFGERHLRRLMVEYLAYYHRDRCHLSLDKDPPEPRAVFPRPAANAEVVALPRVGGLHHRHEWREAA